ncbi:MAG: MBL fold metallo-hydrolase [Pseudomonadota bacterium]
MPLNWTTQSRTTANPGRAPLTSRTTGEPSPNLTTRTIDRRTFSALLAGTTAAGLLVRPQLGWASASNTIDLGNDISVTTITDGYLTLPATFPAPDVEAAARQAAMAAAGQTGDTYKSPINVTLIQTPTEKILVDSGSGAHFMATAGQLTANMEADGIDREAITKVIYTHAHPDHIWGTYDEFDELTFPNATFHISEAEHAYWADPGTLDALPEARKTFAIGAKRNIDSLGEQLQRHQPGDDIVSGITLVDTAGHTPGHVSVLVSAGNKTFMVLGDALNHPVISFQHPTWHPNSDHIKDQAVQTRLKLLDRLVSDEVDFSGYHLPSGGMGRAARKADAFVFEPLT